MATPRAFADSSSSTVLLSLLAQAEDPMVLAIAPAASGEDARIVAVNDAFCRLTARSPDELTDLGWLTLCSTQIDELILDRIRRALFRREHLALDLPLARVEGADVWTHCELLPIRDARGVASAVLIIQRDISEPRQTRDTLATLRAMTRRASHDVNNSLASVIINLSVAGSPRASAGERREGIRDALNAARDAAETAKRLSALASGLDITAAHAVTPAATVAATAASASATAITADETTGPQAAQDAAPQASPDTIRETRGSLLILEDDEIVKAMLANYLGSVGFAVEATTRSDRCIDLFREAADAGRPFDVVVLDLRIGRAGMGGMETLAALLAIDPHVCAIAHSGYSADDVMVNPTRFGFAASIKKPTAPSEIARLLTEAIRLHRSIVRES